ncbi:MAG: hypothetical protein U0361_01930 [Nitrospiraceae bacterium]
MSIGKDSLEAQIQNRFDGGTLQLRYEAAPRWWTQMTAGLFPSTTVPVGAPWFCDCGRLAQVVLAIGITALLAERVPCLVWMG